jgi:alpha-N-acetylglucosaminidase
VQAAAVQELIGRLLPERQHEFQVVVDPLLSDSGRDTFHLVKSAGTGVLKVSGSSGVAAAAGLNHYLKYYCNCQLSWEAKSSYYEWPPIIIFLQVEAVDKFRYYQNVCTVGYSFAWWGWSQWEKHLDWMALNGINLPLAFIGQEAIWQKVWKSLGLNQTDIDQFFAGPAFLPW